jgi:hypothetical protein
MNSGPIQGTLEKTVWNLKQTIENNLTNKNLELILTFMDKTKFELNLNSYSASL